MKKTTKKRDANRVPVSLWIDKKIRARFWRYCDKNGLKRQYVAEAAVREFLERREGADG